MFGESRKKAKRLVKHTQTREVSTILSQPIQTTCVAYSHQIETGLLPKSKQNKKIDSTAFWHPFPRLSQKKKKSTCEKKIERDILKSYGIFQDQLFIYPMQSTYSHFYPLRFTEINYHLDIPKFRETLGPNVS